MSEADVAQAVIRAIDEVRAKGEWPLAIRLGEAQVRELAAAAMPPLPLPRSLPREADGLIPGWSILAMPMYLHDDDEVVQVGTGRSMVGPVETWVTVLPG